MEIKEDGIVFNIENKITIPNEVYEQLLINDYKYNVVLELFKRYSELNGINELGLRYDFLEKSIDFIKLNESEIYDSLVLKYKEKKTNE